MTSQIRFLDMRRVCDRTSLSKTHVDRLAGRGDFPKPVQLSGKRRAWVEEEVDAWCKARLDERTQRGNAA